MLGETKVGGALVAAGLDSSPLVDVIVLAAQLCADQHDVDDLDLNPVIVSDGQALVTDACGPSRRPTRRRRPDPPPRVIDLASASRPDPARHPPTDAAGTAEMESL